MKFLKRHLFFITVALGLSFTQLQAGQYCDGGVKCSKAKQLQMQVQLDRIEAKIDQILAYQKEHEANSLVNKTKEVGVVVYDKTAETGTKIVESTKAAGKSALEWVKTKVNESTKIEKVETEKPDETKIETQTSEKRISETTESK